jgi:hypothetical protein
MYWELSDPDGLSNLVLLALDSGMAANLDGHNNWWQFWKRRIEPDVAQHTWLDARLRRAQSLGKHAIILFHIPPLVKERHEEKYLSTIHAIFAGYPCVSLVLCGHEHNFQGYTPATFRQYVGREILGRDIEAAQFPHYIVCGAGGAYLQSNGYSRGPYQAQRYPSKEEWDKYESWGRGIVSGLGLDKALIGRIVGQVSQDSLSDADVAQYLSFILVEEKLVGGKRKARITPVFLDDLKNLFTHLPAEEIVDVTSENPPVDLTAVEACLQPSITLD